MESYKIGEGFKIFNDVKRSFFFLGVVCTVCFFVGLIFCTGAGEYWLKMFDSFAGTIGLVMVALMEMISVIFVYGHEKYDRNTISLSFK